MPKLAVVLFNLGGPDSPESVQPFLFNLFRDPAIIGLPNPLRWALAKFISSRRAPVAREIYRHIGGGSPLLGHTEAQAAALKDAIDLDGYETAVFVAMRYWHPLTDQAVTAARNWGADEILLLPLYPQFSTTTSGSSIKAWQAAAARQNWQVPTRAVCCYPALAGFAKAQARLIAERLAARSAEDRKRSFRLLFSAHGLPEKIVKAGDPYAMQVRQSADAVIAELRALGIEVADRVVCYQSRVGRLKWIEPYTEDEIRRAGAAGLALLVVPIAFVSEHSETLVELDIEYAELARESGVPAYWRASTVLCASEFVAGLAHLVETRMRQSEVGVCRGDHHGACADDHGACPLRRVA